MRVLFVHERFGFHGGVEQNIYDTAIALRERYHQCFLTSREGTGRSESAFAKAFDIVDLGWNNPSPTSVEIAGLLEQLRCDVMYVHKVPETHFCETHPTRIIRMIHDHDVTCPRRHKYFIWNGKVCNQPVGLCCYADLGFLEKSGKGVALKSIGRVKEEIERQNRFDRVLANSRWMADSLVRNGVDTGRVRVVHPVVPELEDEVTPASLLPNILFVGQLIRGKGVDLLLHALAKVTSDWRLTIAGDGNMRAELERMATVLRIAHKVQFRGWVPSAEARRLYDEARIVCVPSRWPEPFGMVGIEAMRRARPVVGFDVGGISDWLVNEKTGLLIPEADLDAFAAGIERLLQNRDLAVTFGMRGRWTALDKFNFSRYIDRLEAILAGEDMK